MYIINDIAYAGNNENKDIKVKAIKVISELCMLVTFSNEEKRIFDAKYLLQYPAYKCLENFEIFKNAVVEKGIIIWDNGKIDIPALAVYNNSYEYEQDIAM